MKNLPKLLFLLIVATEFGHASTLGNNDLLGGDLCDAPEETYHINRNGTASFAILPTRGGNIAFNPAQQWKILFSPQGFNVYPHESTWRWGLSLREYTGAHNIEPTSQTNTRQVGQAISFERDSNLTEWFINDDRGLQQGWILRNRPERSGSDSLLKLKFDVTGNLAPIMGASSTSVSFVDTSGRTLIDYGGLKAWDSTGTILQTKFTVESDSAISIEVDHQNAKYPIYIDPIAQNSYIKASNTHSYASFGDKVAICGNTAVVGSFSEYSNGKGVNGSQGTFTSPASGAAYIFVKSEGNWVQEAYLKASNAETDDYFGGAVAISGDTIVIGAGTESGGSTGINGNQNNNSKLRSGAVYVFRKVNDSWVQEAYIKASNSDSDDRFGAAVAIHGDTLVVGALREDSAATGINGLEANEDAPESGAAYVFRRINNQWTQQAYLKASNCEAGDLFGISVAISEQTIIVGAWEEDSNAVGINGDQYNNGSADSGAAYIFRNDNGSWTQEAYVKASNTDDFDTYERFGSSVAINDDTMAVSSIFECLFRRKCGYKGLLRRRGAAVAS